ncbi:MAG: tRNA (adenosine(37)-N6)-threonylcarbamoyltransferase complex ATPase subunit type 1 TsaE [Steroidobacteraceae bacterium]
MHTLCRSDSDTEALGSLMAGALPPATAAPLVLYLQGELGAGKTTFARGFMSGLGVPGPVRSPTYTLLELYSAGALTVVHLDLYRLNGVADIEGLGLREWAQPMNVWLIEWPERGAGRLPAADITLTFTVGAGGHDVEASAYTAAGDSWLAEVESRAAKP